MERNWEIIMQTMERTLVGWTDCKKEYKCTKCKDQGYIFGYNDEGYEVAIKCECKIKEEAEEMFKRAGFFKRIEKNTFENYKPNCEETRKAKELAQSYTKDFRGKNLLIIGNSGTGKTHLGVAVLKDILNKGVPVKYVHYLDFIKEIKPLMMLQEERIKALEPYLKTSVLMIDDLYKGFKRTDRGLTGITEADTRLVYELINYRYNNELTTIVTSELYVKELHSIDEAITGRLMELAEGYMITFNKAKNYRYETYKNINQ